MNSLSVRDFVKTVFTARLYGRIFLWHPYIRIFCDSGQPIFRWMPGYRRLHYNPYWGMYGFALYLLGREITFSFGKDRKGLYKSFQKDAG